MPPRATLEAEDLVTPTQAARLLGVPASTVRTWIERHRVERLGWSGRWPVYDYNELAAIEAEHRTAA
jgi:transposase-like protein